MSRRNRSRHPLKCLREARKQTTAIGTAHGSLNVVLGVRHHTEHVALLADNSGYGVDRPIDVPGRIPATVGSNVAIKDTPLALQTCDGLRIGDIITLTVSDRHFDDLSGIVSPRERAVGSLDAQIDIPRYESERGVTHQYARQQASLAQNLKAVADAEHKSATGGVRAHRVHDRRPRRDG